jgi:hypothetical protein
MANSFVRNAAIFVALTVCLSGWGKKSENAISEKSAANYPLPDPPVVVDCTPGVPGGRLVVAELADPKTFNYIMVEDTIA